MSRYIDADLLVRKIKGQIRLENLNFAALGGGGQTFCINTLEWVLKQIYSLQQEQQEEPDKSLEEAAEEYRQGEVDTGCDYIDDSDGDSLYHSACLADAFIAGAEYQARQLLQGSPMPEDTVLFNKGVQEGRRLEREDMLKDAVEGYVNYYEDSGGILMAEAQVGCPYHNGQKVRIVVLKEKEE